MRRRHVIAGLLAGILAAAPPLVGQNEVLGKQERARAEFRELHERMQKLQVVLRERNPEDSRVLEAGNRYVQEAGIHEDMATIRELLRQEAWDAALERMREVRKELGTLVELLLDRETDLHKLLDEIERLEGFKKRVEKLIGDQRREKEAAVRTEAWMQHLAALERAAAELEALAKEQRELRSRADRAGLRAPPPAAREMAGREERLQKQARRLAGELQSLEKESRDLQDSAAGAKGGKQAGDAEGARGADGACSGPCEGAAGAMGEAAKKLQQNLPERSLGDMDRALEELDAAEKALAAMAERARRELLELPLERQARDQEVTRIETNALAEEMEKAGGRKNGAKDGPAPGARNVRQAVPEQKAAAGMLKEHRPRAARKKQEDAKENLEEAEQALEDALAQLREQLQDEVLRALEERFGVMLARQKVLSARTKVADRLRAETLLADGRLPAALAQHCKELSAGEGELASEAAGALALLREEGSTAVFPEIVVGLRSDLSRLSERLAEYRTGRATQSMQAGVEETLRMLLDALRRTIENKEGRGDGQCEGGPPLVPLSAELKLIQALQKNVAKRTRSYDASTPAEMRATAEARDEAAEISRQQGRVEALTRKLAHKIAKDDQLNDR